jgi:hypothetical protein
MYKGKHHRVSPTAYQQYINNVTRIKGLRRDTWARVKAKVGGCSVGLNYMFEIRVETTDGKVNEP